MQMIKKKTIMIGISLLVLIGVLAACEKKTEEGMTPAVLGIVATDAELFDMFSVEPHEPAASDTGLDYMEYIRPIEPLVNGRTWLTPADIDPVDLLVWYAIREREQNGADLSGFQASGEDGYRFPKAAVEDAVAKYFGSVDLLRNEADGFLDSESNEYVLPAIPLINLRTICITKVEEMGKSRNLYFTVTVNQASQNYLLTLTDNDGVVQYNSLTRSGDSAN